MAEHQIRDQRIDDMKMVVAQKVIGVAILHISPKEDHLSNRLNNPCLRQACTEQDSNPRQRCLHSPIIMSTTTRH